MSTNTPTLENAATRDADATRAMVGGLLLECHALLLNNLSLCHHAEAVEDLLFDLEAERQRLSRMRAETDAGDEPESGQAPGKTSFLRLVKT